jgi:hypothetical protein
MHRISRRFKQLLHMPLVDSIAITKSLKDEHAFGCQLPNSILVGKVVPAIYRLDEPCL